MRYYQILIGGQLAWTTLMQNPVSGMTQTDPGALNIEFDIPVAPQAAATGTAYLRVWGIPQSLISQSSNYNGQTFQLFGGMSAGLPLANPAQQGILAQGLVQQCWGNWIGVNMTLDFLLNAGWNAPGTAATATTADQSKTAGGASTVGPQTPLNLILNWLPGTTLATAIGNTLNTALPGWTNNINISSSLLNTKTSAIAGAYQNLQQFAEFLLRRSSDMISSNPYGGTGYQGVQTVVNGSTINIFDGQGSTPAPAATAIAFTDLVGQPTWQSAREVQVTCILRGDLSIGQMITLPPSQVTIQSGQGFAPNTTRNTSIFQGTFQINKLRHVGNYKQPHGESWITLIDCVVAPPAQKPVPQGTVDIGAIDINPV